MHFLINILFDTQLWLKANSSENFYQNIVTRFFLVGTAIETLPVQQIY